MKKTRFVAVVLALALPTGALADTLTPGTGEYGHITRLGRGLMELGLDNVMIVKSISETIKGTNGGDDTTTKALQAVFVGGPTFRYFVIDNLSLALNANFEVRHASTSTEVGSNDPVENKTTAYGFLGALMADYYISFGRGMFLKPGIGGGYFFAKENTPVEVNGKQLTESRSRAGGVARFQLGLVYYTSRNSNLKASVDVLGRFGSVTPEDEGKPTRDLLEVDTGWNVGFSYVF